MTTMRCPSSSNSTTIAAPALPVPSGYGTTVDDARVREDRAVVRGGLFGLRVEPEIRDDALCAHARCNAGDSNVELIGRPRYMTSHVNALWLRRATTNKADDMQFGIFSVSDITREPGHGLHAERGGADRRDRADRPARRRGRARRLRDRRAPQPAVLLLVADDAAGAHRRADRAHRPEHGDHADHDQRPGEDRRGLRDAPAPGQGADGPDARPRQHRAGVSVVRPGHPQGPRARAGELQPAAPAVARGRRGLGGQLPHAAAGLHLDPAAARRRAAVRLARLDPHAGDRRAGRLLRQRLLRQQHPRAELPLQAAGRPLPPALRALRPRHAGAGDRRARRPGVHRQALAGRRRRRSARTSRARRSTARATGSRTSCTARR